MRKNRPGSSGPLGASALFACSKGYALCMTRAVPLLRKDVRWQPLRPASGPRGKEKRMKKMLAVGATAALLLAASALTPAVDEGDDVGFSAIARNISGGHGGGLPVAGVRVRAVQLRPQRLLGRGAAPALLVHVLRTGSGYPPHTRTRAPAPKPSNVRFTRAGRGTTLLVARCRRELWERGPGKGPGGAAPGCRLLTVAAAGPNARANSA